MIISHNGQYPNVTCTKCGITAEQDYMLLRGDGFQHENCPITFEDASHAVVDEDGIIRDIVTTHLTRALAFAIMFGIVCGIIFGASEPNPILTERVSDHRQVEGKR